VNHRRILSYFTTAFTDICNDPNGEPTRAKLYVRLNDGTGGAPSTLVELTATQTIKELPPIVRAREYKPGILQGQSWQVKVTNNNKALLAYDFKDCWCCIRGGFSTADVWATFAQGKIKRSVKSTDGTVTLEIHDVIMDLLKFEIPRDIMYQDSEWVSEVKSITRDADSRSYDNDASGAGVVIYQNASNIRDETFLVVFTSATAFKIVLEDGDDSQTGTISADATIWGLADAQTSGRMLQLNFEGWSTDSGAYAAGDTFAIYTAEARTAAELSPVHMIQHLIDDVAGITVYDVITGANYTYPRFDTTNWTSLATDAEAYTIGGEWSRGTTIAKMIQDLLKVVQGAVYPSPTGQLALWVLQPATSVAATLNGVRGNGPISIISMVKDDDIREATNEVTIEYLSMDGTDASYTAVDSDTTLHGTYPQKFSVGWRLDGPTAENGVNKHLSRFSAGLESYVINTTLAGAVADIAEAVTMIEDELGLSLEQAEVYRVSVNLLDSSAQISAMIDPAVLSTKAKIDSAEVDGTEVIW